MSDALCRAGHVGAFFVDGERGLDVAEDEVAAHAGGEVKHDVDFGRADALGDFAVEVAPARGSAGFGVAHVTMHDGGAGPGGVNGGCSDLFGRDRHMWRAAGGVT